MEGTVAGSGVSKSLFGDSRRQTFEVWRGLFGKDTATFEGVSMERTTSPKTSKV